LRRTDACVLLPVLPAPPDLYRRTPLRTTGKTLTPGMKQMRQGSTRLGGTGSSTVLPATGAYRLLGLLLLCGFAGRLLVVCLQLVAGACVVPCAPAASSRFLASGW
jgi:hypothetical protein